MLRVLITGMSGTGKSTLLERLAALGYKTAETDADPSLRRFVPVEGEATRNYASNSADWAETAGQEGEWLWNEERIQQLLSTEDAEVLFLCGTAPNQVKFYPQFDHIILLSAPAQVILDRVRSRTGNPYGQNPTEQEQIRSDLEAVEPLLRRGATLEIDTTPPIEQVLEAVLDAVIP
ncbi:MAG TPA: AAA family ATPase [Mycobacteriales bacterium]|nr:AAA family ATPase [Mycobacteriales bacterium]